MLKYIIIIIPLALLAFGLVTACVLMEKAEEVRHGRFNQKPWKGGDDDTL